MKALRQCAASMSDKQFAHRMARSPDGVSDVPLTSNTEGQMYALTVLAPIVPGEVDALQQTLADLPRDPSPLSRAGFGALRAVGDHPGLRERSQSVAGRAT